MLERITAGETANNQYPYQVSVQYGFDLIFAAFVSHTCGGSVLTETWIMTAGHCITAHNNWFFNRYYVLAGVKDVKGKGQFKKVSKYFVHPKYGG